MARRFRFSNNRGGGKSIVERRKQRAAPHFESRQTSAAFFRPSAMGFWKPPSKVSLRNKLLENYFENVSRVLDLFLITASRCRLIAKPCR